MSDKKIKQLIRRLQLLNKLLVQIIIVVALLGLLKEKLLLLF